MTIDILKRRLRSLTPVSSMYMHSRRGGVGVASLGGIGYMQWVDMMVRQFVTKRMKGHKCADLRFGRNVCKPHDDEGDF